MKLLFETCFVRHVKERRDIVAKEESTKSYHLMNFLRINDKLDERRE